VQEPESRLDGPADLLTVEEAARRLRIGRTTMYALISAGTVESVTIGRRRLVPPECVAAYVAVLRSAGQSAPAAA
jgi:excisionase family DNA binding protein